MSPSAVGLASQGLGLPGAPAGSDERVAVAVRQAEKLDLLRGIGTHDIRTTGSEIT